MDLRDYSRLLRLRWRLIALCALLGLAAAAAVSMLTTPIYQAQTKLFVSVKNDGGISALAQGGQFTQQRVKSYADIVASPAVTQAVIDQLGLKETPETLADKVSASNPLDTVLLNVSVKDPDPRRAKRIADAVGAQFGKLVNELETPQGGDISPVKVSVVHPADLPTSPVSPRTKLNLALGLLVGLAVGVGGAVLRESLDTSVKTVEELQEEHGTATLGVIGYDPEAPKRPLIVHSSPHSARSESFRQLRTNLQFVDVDTAPRSIVITSSVPQEGKTSSACNLAITLGQAGVQVALVEGDLRRPRVMEYMGLDGAVGVTSVLIGRASLDEALQAWGDGLLTVLGSGPAPPNPSELLGSQGMADLVHELEKRFDLVIIDAPPLLPVTDAAVLGSVTSGAVLVVRCGGTRREQVGQALASLHSVDVHVFGAILNMAPKKGPDAYRYGYGYGYGTYAPRPRTDVHPPLTPARPAAPAPAATTTPGVHIVTPAPTAHARTILPEPPRGERQPESPAETTGPIPAVRYDELRPPTPPTEPPPAPPASSAEAPPASSASNGHAAPADEQLLPAPADEAWREHRYDPADPPPR